MVRVKMFKQNNYDLLDYILLVFSVLRFLKRLETFVPKTEMKHCLNFIAKVSKQPQENFVNILEKFLELIKSIQN